MFNYFFRPSKKPQPSHPFSVEKDALKKRYQHLVQQHHIKTDLAQVAVLESLQHLLYAMAEQRHPEKSAKSLYIFGDVGRGKSLLMELFFEACPIKQKRRVHFHNFMLEVHAFVHQWRKNNQSDPLAAFAKQLRHSTWLLCFDEFNVTDIADAMILTRLFNHLFAEGLIFVATSNYHPDNLYKGGLQHDLFLPFIARLKQASDILELVAIKDYRLRPMDALNYSFHIGLGIDASHFLTQKLAQLSHNALTHRYSLNIQQREVVFNAVSGRILYSSFDELCHRNLGSADYIEISNCFDTVFIAEIPQLSIECRDQARRFVTLIDALYEANIKLICSAAVAIDSLYKEDGVFEFRRTQSRLTEMQSADYRQRRKLLQINP
ncbi:MAG: cell division protein ZapE [Methylococcales bacterium]|nr:cell division protein ZapE [Methylococcales bacterium]